MAWISVEDRLPEKDGEYIVQLENNIVRSAYFATSLEDVDCKDWVDENWEDHPGFFDESVNNYGEYDGAQEVIVKYWQPLPEPVTANKKELKYSKKLDTILDEFEKRFATKYNIVIDEEDGDFLEKSCAAMLMAFVGLIFEGSLLSDSVSKAVDSELEKIGY